LKVLGATISVNTVDGNVPPIPWEVPGRPSHRRLRSCKSSRCVPKKMGSGFANPSSAGGSQGSQEASRASERPRTEEGVNAHASPGESSPAGPIRPSYHPCLIRDRYAVHQHELMEMGLPRLKNRTRRGAIRWSRRTGPRLVGDGPHSTLWVMRSSTRSAESSRRSNVNTRSTLAVR